MKARRLKWDEPAPALAGGDHDGRVNPADLLTTRQAAERLGKSVATINRLAAAGKLRAEWKAPGDTGAYYFTADALADYEGEAA